MGQKNKGRKKKIVTRSKKTKCKFKKQENKGFSKGREGPFRESVGADPRMQGDAGVRGHASPPIKFGPSLNVKSDTNLALRILRRC